MIPPKSSGEFVARMEAVLDIYGLARALARRLEIVPTPKHGSWLNIAENELSALTTQCVKGRRFATIEELRDEVMAWALACNAKQKGVDWQFTTDQARIKLKSLYPKFLM